MKIVIIVRQLKEGERPDVRVDTKYENLDTPTVQHYGNLLVKAIESGMEERKK